MMFTEVKRTSLIIRNSSAVIFQVTSTTGINDSDTPAGGATWTDINPGDEYYALNEHSAWWARPKTGTDLGYVLDIEQQVAI